jgi:molybdate transport system substrate-binding protein
MRRIALLLVALLLSMPAGAADVIVFAAASLKESMDAVARQFEAATGNKVVVAYAASSALARQIENGAPADLFMSADLDWADFLDDRKLLMAGTRINLLRNELVLIAPADSKSVLKLVPGVDLAAALGKDRLAIANPDAVPAGKYARAALASLGAWAAVESRLARAENVRAALLLVSRGEAPFGIVYRTDALADKGVRIVGSFPADSHPPIVYPVALTASSRSAAAMSLIHFLAEPMAGATWLRFGFALAR